MQPSIKKAEITHAKNISRICTEGWKQTVQGKYDEAYQKKNVEHWYNLEKIKEDIENGIYTHVAIVNDEVVGTIGGILSDNGTSEIYVFYIDENYRYKGIGTKLLDAYTCEHKKKGATKQVVSVEEGNKLGTPFYIARGFKQDEANKRYWRKINQQQADDLKK